MFCKIMLGAGMQVPTIIKFRSITFLSFCTTIYPKNASMPDPDPLISHSQSHNGFSPQTSSIASKMRKHISSVWDYFKKIQQYNDENTVCVMCNKFLIVNSSTATLTHHDKRNDKYKVSLQSLTIYPEPNKTFSTGSSENPLIFFPNKCKWDVSLFLV